ncbi:MAG: MarR family transcriptional regulator [Parasulfuritortus sp.]|nr:MarR family transcriptional regulator [Parasulfuritortus sp.]
MNVLVKKTEDVEVIWARRQESIRGVLKLIRVMLLAVQKHSLQTEIQSQVSAPELWILWELNRAPGLRVLDLAKAMAIHVSSVRTMVMELEQRGLIRSLVSIDNPNVTRLSLTESGRYLVEEAPGPARGVIVDALERLDDPALERLVDALQPLIATMEYTDNAAALKPLAELLNHKGITVARPFQRGA